MFRKLKEEDAYWLLEIKDKEINKYLLYDYSTLTIEQEKEWINKNKDRDVYILEEVEPIGIIDIRKKDKNNYGIGLWVRKKYWGKGYGKRLIEFAKKKVFEDYKGSNIYLSVFKDNKRARKLYEKCGFDYSGYRRFLNTKNIFYDDLLMEIPLDKYTISPSKLSFSSNIKKIKDLESIKDILLELYPSTADYILSDLSNETYGYYSKDLIGVISFRDFNYSILEIKYLFVKPSYQRRSIGSSLLSFAISYAKSLNKQKLGLFVNSNNKGALSFYYKNGFRRDGFIANYYSNEDDALFLTRTINSNI